ncbi:hypothetical protein [Terasakiella sp. SH-1]|uniref:hypothetical protein n=1 Tax=Terasakiella sp. SH-1 TaxID=2560057 RepID=UPI001073A534|nr:hypothetical protein [Terasakiella sp. SH-1]
MITLETNSSPKGQEATCKQLAMTKTEKPRGTVKKLTREELEVSKFGKGARYPASDIYIPEK